MSTASSVAGNTAIRRGHVIQLSIGVAAVIAALVMVDVSLEKMEQGELASQAIRADQNGQKLLAQDRAGQAVDAFRNAHALERENTKYELDLIQGLMAAGKLADAQPLMTEILDQQSNNGEANLIAAHLAARQGDINSADSYYHRAIYGEWPGQTTRHQIETRLELINFLSQHGREDEVLAELLPLQEQAAKDAALQPKLAELFLAAGSAARARDIYRELIKADPRNAGNYAGLGDAELALGDFRGAHLAFANAVAHDGKDETLRARLELTTTLVSIDPTARRLSDSEKYSRSMRVLQMATDDLGQCVAKNSALATHQMTDLFTSAEAQLAAHPPRQATNEAAEAVLSLAERVWHARTDICASVASSNDQALRLVMDKLAK
jgi:cytochrome c-type biogenesis protein CcmH/NrfG